MVEKVVVAKYGLQCIVGGDVLCVNCPGDGFQGGFKCQKNACERALEVIEQLEKTVEDQAERIAIMAADMPRWYPASMKPEKDDEDYFVLTKDDGIIILRFLEGEWGLFAECFVDGGCSGEEWVGIEKLKIEFTHWMEIPKSPKEDDDHDYEQASDNSDYCEQFEPTYNPEDGSM